MNMENLFNNFIHHYASSHKIFFSSSQQAITKILLLPELDNWGEIGNFYKHVVFDDYLQNTKDAVYVSFAPYKKLLDLNTSWAYTKDRKTKKFIPAEEWDADHWIIFATLIDDTCLFVDIKNQGVFFAIPGNDGEYHKIAAGFYDFIESIMRINHIPVEIDNKIYKDAMGCEGFAPEFLDRVNKILEEVLKNKDLMANFRECFGLI